MKKTSPGFDNCLLRNKGGGVFEDRTTASGLSGHDLGYNLGVAAGDYDNDGYTDLFVCSAGDGNPKQPGRCGREGCGYDCLRQKAVQPCVNLDRFDVFLRPA